MKTPSHSAMSLAMILLLTMGSMACQRTTHTKTLASAEQPAGQPSAPALSKLCFTDARLDQQLFLLSNQHGTSITSLGEIGAERVPFFENETDLESILDKIAKPRGWTWIRFDDGSYGIASEEWYRANTLGPCMSPTKVFRPDHIRASELQSPLRAMLSESGRMNHDDRTNKIIIVDSHDSIARIERFIREVDLPPSP